jgi:hypothetical protein
MYFQIPTLLPGITLHNKWSGLGIQFSSGKSNSLNWMLNVADCRDLRLVTAGGTTSGTWTCIRSKSEEVAYLKVEYEIVVDVVNLEVEGWIHGEHEINFSSIYRIQLEDWSKLVYSIIGYFRKLEKATEGAVSE